MTIPHCDLSTGKIYGCKKGSREWWHEKGHLKFNELESTSRLKLFQNYFHSLWMLSITLCLFNKWFLVVALPSVLFYLGIDWYEEHWCWKYADFKIKKKKNGEKEKIKKDR